MWSLRSVLEKTFPGFLPPKEIESSDYSADATERLRPLTFAEILAASSCPEIGGFLPEAMGRQHND